MSVGHHSEPRHVKRQMCLNCVPEMVAHRLQFADHSHHGQDGFDQHPCVPHPARGDLQIRRLLVFGMEARIVQEHYIVFDGLNQGLTHGLRRMGGVLLSGDDQLPLIQQQTPWTAHNPAMIREAVCSTLSWMVSFSNRVDEFDAIDRHHAQNLRGRQRMFAPRVMGRTLPKQPRSVWPCRKRVAPMLAKPSMTCLSAVAFQHSQTGQGDDVTRRQRRGGDARHAVVTVTPPCSETIARFHEMPSFSHGVLPEGFAHARIATPCQEGHSTRTNDDEGPEALHSKHSRQHTATTRPENGCFWENEARKKGGGQLFRDSDL